MIPHQDLADLTRQYSEANRELRDALADRERLVAQFKATGIRPTREFSEVGDRIRMGADIVAMLRQTLETANGGVR